MQQKRMATASENAENVSENFKDKEESHTTNENERCRSESKSDLRLDENGKNTSRLEEEDRPQSRSESCERKDLKIETKEATDLKHGVSEGTTDEKKSDPKHKCEILNIQERTSPSFDFSPLQASLSESISDTCNITPKCGPLSNSCGPVFTRNQLYEGPVPLSLSVGVKGLFGNGNKDVFSNPLCSGKSEPNGSFCQPFSNSAPTGSNSEKLNPSLIHNAISTSEVVRTQPSITRLQDNPSQFSIPPLRSCTCINPGTSHACASRPIHKTSLGVMNPLFDQNSSQIEQSLPDLPSSPRKFSLDSTLRSRGLTIPDYPIGPITTCSLSPLPANMTRSLIQNSSSPMPGIPSVTEGCMAYGNPCQPTMSKGITNQTPFLNCMQRETASNHSSHQHSASNVLSPNWFSMLTPSPEAYAQKLFSPEDLNDELLYPTPYGISSEVYQNLNAKEADFVLLKPNRRPRAASLASSSSRTIDKPASTNLSELGAKGNSSSDEASLKEGSTGSKKNSLSERRKSSLEKIFIPSLQETVNSVLDVKVDNFDRDEYINFKKRLSASDSLSTDKLKGNMNSYQIKPFSLPLKTKSDGVLFMQHCPSEIKKKSCKESEIQIQNKMNLGKKTKKVTEKHKEYDSLSSLTSNSNSSSKDSYESKGSSKRNVKDKRTDSPKNNHISQKQLWNDDLAYFKSQLSARKNMRKQSLPTEELLSSRYTKMNRKTSLNPLCDSQALERMKFKHATVSPVKEIDESFGNWGEDCSRTKSFGKRHSIANVRDSGPLQVRKDSLCESPERRKHSKRFQKQRQSSSHQIEDLKKAKGKSRHKRDKKSSHHSKSRTKDSSHKSHHHSSKETHRSTHSTIMIPEKERKMSITRAPPESSAYIKKQRNLPQSSSSNKSPRKSQLQPKTPQRNPYMSPLGPGYEINFPDPAVPYELLDDSPSPAFHLKHSTSSGAARKETCHRKPKRKHRHGDQDDYFPSSSSSSSSNSSSPSRSSSKRSSDSSSGSSSDYSSSSSGSDTSDTESTSSSSSSSSSSTSSSSDSSDIQDLIL